MPCTAVKCTCRPGEDLPLTHWDVECPLPPIQRGWYRRILQNTLDDKVHAAGAVTITRLLGCPRKSLIADYLPYTLDPAAHHAMHLGTVVHREAQAGLPPGYRAEVEVHGKLFGLEVSGRLDCLGASVINEAKFHRYVGMKWKLDNQKLVDEDNVAQVNMQRILLGQMFKDKPSNPINQDYMFRNGVPSHMLLSHSSDSEPGWPTEPLPVRDEVWVGEHRPMNGSYRVKDIAGFFYNALAAIKPLVAEAPTDYEERVKVAINSNVPFVGKVMMPRKDGKFQQCTKYCMYRERCPGWTKDASQA